MATEYQLMQSQLRDLGLASREAVVLAEFEERRYAHLRPGDEETLLSVARPKQVLTENKGAMNSWQQAALDAKDNLRDLAEHDPVAKADLGLFSGQLHRLHRKIDIDSGLGQPSRAGLAEDNKRLLMRQRDRLNALQAQQVRDQDAEYARLGPSESRKKGGGRAKNTPQGNKKSERGLPFNNKSTGLFTLGSKQIPTGPSRANTQPPKNAIWNLATKRVPPIKNQKPFPPPAPQNAPVSPRSNRSEGSYRGFSKDKNEAKLPSKHRPPPIPKPLMAPDAWLESFAGLKSSKDTPKTRPVSKSEAPAATKPGSSVKMPESAKQDATTSLKGQLPRAPATIPLNTANQSENNGTGDTPFSQVAAKIHDSTTAVFQTITAMDSYKQFSTEELRVEDYTQNTQDTKESEKISTASTKRSLVSRSSSQPQNGSKLGDLGTAEEYYNVPTRPQKTPALRMPKSIATLPTKYGAHSVPLPVPSFNQDVEALLRPGDQLLGYQTAHYSGYVAPPPGIFRTVPIMNGDYVAPPPGIHVDIHAANIRAQQLNAETEWTRRELELNYNELERIKRERLEEERLLAELKALRFGPVESTKSKSTPASTPDSINGHGATQSSRVISEDFAVTPPQQCPSPTLTKDVLSAENFITAFKSKAAQPIQQDLYKSKWAVKPVQKAVTRYGTQGSARSLVSINNDASISTPSKTPSTDAVSPSSITDLEGLHFSHSPDPFSNISKRGNVDFFADLPVKIGALATSKWASRPTAPKTRTAGVQEKESFEGAIIEPRIKLAKVRYGRSELMAIGALENVDESVFEQSDR